MNFFSEWCLFYSESLFRKFRSYYLSIVLGEEAARAAAVQTERCFCDTSEEKYRQSSPWSNHLTQTTPSEVGRFFFGLYVTTKRWRLKTKKF